MMQSIEITHSAIALRDICMAIKFGDRRTDARFTLQGILNELFKEALNFMDPSIRDITWKGIETDRENSKRDLLPVFLTHIQHNRFGNSRFKPGDIVERNQRIENMIYPFLLSDLETEQFNLLQNWIEGQILLPQGPELICDSRGLFEFFKFKYPEKFTVYAQVTASAISCFKFSDMNYVSPNLLLHPIIDEIIHETMSIIDQNQHEKTLDHKTHSGSIYITPDIKNFILNLAEDFSEKFSFEEGKGMSLKRKFERFIYPYSLNIEDKVEIENSLDQRGQ